MARAKKEDCENNLSDNIAENIRERIAKLTSPLSVPDPLAIAHIDTFSSGFFSLDHALGIGGWAKGRMHVLEGPPGCGKTALALASIAAYQKQFPNSIHAYMDIERTLNISFAKMLGVNCSPDRFIVLQPETVEECCIIAMNLMGYEEKKNEWEYNPSLKTVNSITHDSWSGSATKTVGLAALARVGSLWIPRLLSSMGRRNITFFMINQLREKVGMSFGDPRYGPGGKALLHAPSTKFWISTTNIAKTDDKASLSHDVKLEMKRSKFAPPSAPFFLHLDYRTGFDYIGDIFTFLEMKGISFKETSSGNIYKMQFICEDGVEEIKENGLEKFQDKIRANEYAIKFLQQKAQELK